MARACESDEAWKADLESADGATVVSALHAACPCEGKDARVRYEEFMPLVHRFKKDDRPEVRKTALHLEQDALEHLALDDEEAGGFVRNRPGGNGRRGELKRAARRHGLR